MFVSIIPQCWAAGTAFHSSAFLEWPLNGTIALAVSIPFRFQQCSGCASPHALTVIAMYFPDQWKFPLTVCFTEWKSKQPWLLHYFPTTTYCTYIHSDVHVLADTSLLKNSLRQWSIDCFKDAPTCHRVTDQHKQVAVLCSSKLQMIAQAVCHLSCQWTRQSRVKMGHFYTSQWQAGYHQVPSFSAESESVW